MKTLKETIKTIFKEDKKLFVLVVLVLFLGLVLFIYTVLTLDPTGAVVKVGYDDVTRGYQNGPWTDMLVFPLAAFLLGVLHPVLSLRLYEKKGGGMTRLFLMMTIGIMVGMFILMVRLLSEG